MEVSKRKGFAIICCFILQMFASLVVYGQAFYFQFEDTHINAGVKVIEFELIDCNGNAIYCLNKAIQANLLEPIKDQVNFETIPFELVNSTEKLRITLIDPNSSDTLSILQINQFKNIASQLGVSKMESDRLLSIENTLIEYGLQRSISFLYNGKLETYEVVNYKNRYWLAKNLGAVRVAQSLNDTLSYGDVFQWGRQADGHQNPRSIPHCQKEVIISDNIPLFCNFMEGASSSICWKSQWYNGTIQMKSAQNVCPNGWHVPTDYEWAVAIEGWKDLNDAFNSVLKIPAAYKRDINGTLSMDDKNNRLGINSSVHYWSSTQNFDMRKNNAAATMMLVGRTISIFDSYSKKNGFPVRCIKDLPSKNGNPSND